MFFLFLSIFSCSAPKQKGVAPWDLGLEMVLIKAGTFTMESGGGRR
jgi:hypothetical protein